MSMLQKAMLTSVAIGVASTMLFVAPPVANAQGASCDRLWYERNEIYARNGYCFKPLARAPSSAPVAFLPSAD